MAAHLLGAAHVLHRALDRVARRVENVMACTDCGFSTAAGAMKRTAHGDPKAPTARRRVKA